MLVLRVFLATLALPATLIATQVITVSVSRLEWPPITNPLEFSTSVPSGSQLFSHEEEILASVSTANYDYFLCSLSMKTIQIRNKR